MKCPPIGVRSGGEAESISLELGVIVFSMAVGTINTNLLPSATVEIPLSSNALSKATVVSISFRAATRTETGDQMIFG